MLRRIRAWFSALARREPAEPPAPPPPVDPATVRLSPALKAEVHRLMDEGMNVSAIQRLRDETGMSLKDSMHYFEEMISARFRKP